MAKRFTDSNKWADEWFSDLEPDMKLVWLFLLDNCDHAGIWKRNIKLLKYSCGTVREQLEIQEILNDRIFIFEDKWFIPKYLKFQYSSGIGNNMPALVSVRKQLEKYNLIERVIEQFGNSFVTIKDKDKDIDKDKVNNYNKANFSKNSIPKNIWIDNVEHKPIKNGDGWVYPTIEAVSVTDDNLAVFEDNTTQPLGKRQTALKSQNCLDLKMVKKGLVQ